MKTAEFVSTAERPERLGNRIKKSLGMAAVKLTAIVGGATAVFGAGSTLEATTGHEARAEAFGGYHITGAEKAWCRWPSRWAICNKANELGGAAQNAAARVSAEKGWSVANGGADAVRHCYWNALMTNEFGRETAAGIGWRHEYDDTQTAEEQQMDLHNNLKGRDWASEPNPLQRCISGVESGELIRLEP